MFRNICYIVIFEKVENPTAPPA